MPSDEWYSEGLHFECTACGNCCTGPPGWVHFTLDEAEQISSHLRLDLEQFIEGYTHIVMGRRSLKEIQTEHGYDCVFLDRESIPGKAICSVYPVRPQQCRTWPFWPENLRSRRQWERAGRNCPGMDKGPHIPIESIRIQRDSTPS